MKRFFPMLFYIIALSPCFAGVEAKVLNPNMIAGDNLLFTIEIEEPYTGTADLKFCLAEFDFSKLSYNYRCDIFLERFNIELDKTFTASYSLSLAGVQPLIYRLFVQLHYEDKYRKDSDADNFIYIAGSNEPNIFVYNPRGVVINPENPPVIVEKGREFSTTFEVISYENCTNYHVHSYVYKDTECITGAFNSNLVDIGLTYASRTKLVLNNTVNLNATAGNYYYKIRVNACGTYYETSQPVIVAENSNPYFETIFEENDLLLKNYDEGAIEYNISVKTNNKNYWLNGTIEPHTRKNFKVTEEDYYIKLFINDNPVFEELVLNEANNTPLSQKEETSKPVVEALPITAEASAKEIEEKPFYILSILTSIGALGVLYWRLK